MRKLLSLMLLSMLIFAAFSVSAMAKESTVSLKGTDSQGSYSFDADEGKPATPPEGSKSKPRVRPEGSKTQKGKEGHGFKHRSMEGSHGKSYSHKRHHGVSKHGGYSHGTKGGHSEGSGHGRYSHGKKQSGHGEHGGHGKNPFTHVLCYKKKLGLTDKQIQVIKDAEFNYKKNKIRIHTEHKIAHMELERLAHSGDVDESAMRALADRIAKTKSDSIHAMVEAKIEMLKILTPEQRKKVAEMHASK